MEIQNVNLVDQSANLNAYLDGTHIISSNSDLLDVEKFTGGTANSVVSELEFSDSIQSVDVSFTPFWLKRIPTLEDHIRVIVESPGGGE